LGCAAQRIGERRQALALLAAAAPAAAMAVGAAVMLSGARAADVAPIVDSVVPPGACALSDSPKYLVTSDRFLGASRNCPPLVDPFGATLALGEATTEERALWRDLFARVDYVVSDRPIERWYISAEPALLHYVHAHFNELRRGSMLFYVRSGAQ
jgi:hypothetical protein